MKISAKTVAISLIVLFSLAHGMLVLPGADAAGQATKSQNSDKRFRRLSLHSFRSALWRMRFVRLTATSRMSF